MNFSSIALLATASLTSICAATKYNLELGYVSALVVTPGGGVGCGPWTRLTAQDGSVSYPTNAAPQNDGCPSADANGFCSRWGCPKGYLFAGNTFAVEVLRDSGSSVVAKATKLNGGSQTVMCGKSSTVISGNGKPSLSGNAGVDLCVAGA
ncbi:hypothetical protein OPT61_g4826 [Boeremia exigua]|uniref:Uncharacterized protein n=1 Tax=Boeremia exigua TaxID=749465 RepID=A0ACC2ICI7_9PLEO|nr:hypothetical protein OPT61_g4826 [Boeremia exigua]